MSKKREREEEEEENLITREEEIEKERDEQEALLYKEAILYMFGLKLGEMSSLMSALEEVKAPPPPKRSRN